MAVQSEYFVQYISYWQNARYKYIGPFATENEAESAVADSEILLDCNFVTGEQRAMNIIKDQRYRIVTASEVDMRDFVACTNSEDKLPLLDIDKIKNKKIRRFLDS